ncbi:MAG: hypothetical protein U0835_13510 [Isosphaeraceae bacterium]
MLLLALGLVHVPLPQPDFHNIRHHDSPGELCEHHDHLLRWHPDAGSATDVAVLHWHWVLPAGGGDSNQAEPSDGSTAAIHADAPDWPSGTLDEAPSFILDRGARPGDSPFAHLMSPPVAAFLPDPLGLALCAPRGPNPPARACGAPHAGLVVLLQRWVC